MIVCLPAECRTIDVADKTGGIWENISGKTKRTRMGNIQGRVGGFNMGKCQTIA